MAILNFDAETVKPAAGFEPVPPGKYHAVIIESGDTNTDDGLTPTKNGSGKYLKLTFEIISDEYKGRRIFERLNIINANPKAADIAKGNLSAICHCLKIKQIKDSSELHNKPMIINVSIRAANGQYAASNEIKGYEPLMRSAPKPQVLDPTVQTESKPWEY